MLGYLNKVNKVDIYDVKGKEFVGFGRIIEGFDFSDLINYMEEETEIRIGNNYVASVEELEKYPIKKEIENILYGGMQIQIGYCNGTNSTYNGFEYHKGSETLIAVTDLMLVLAHKNQIINNKISVNSAKVFYVPKGTAIELYQTTLHLSPCKTNYDGYKSIIILPKGTNEELSEEEKEIIKKSNDPESKLLLKRNKWVIAHPDREQLISQGAYPGVIGENIKLRF